MGLFDRIGREIGKGIGAVGGFLGDVIGGATESFSDPGFQLPTGGGFGRKLGGLLGEAGEIALGGFIPQATYPTPQFPLPPTVPGQLPGLPGQLPSPVGTPPFFPQATVPRGGGTMPTEIPVPGAVFPFETAGMLPQLPSGGMEMATPVALPGGALIGPLLRQLPGVIGGGAAAALALQEAGVELPFGGRLFKSTMAGVRPNRLVMVRHPVTQAPVFFKHAGRPLLFSSDMAAARKVDRLARRAKRTRRGR